MMNPLMALSTMTCALGIPCAQVDGWEKQGIPVSRLSSLDSALGIVEELNKLQEATEEEAQPTWRTAGLRVGDGRRTWRSMAGIGE